MLPLASNFPNFVARGRAGTVLWEISAVSLLVASKTLPFPPLGLVVSRLDTHQEENPVSGYRGATSPCSPSLLSLLSEVNYPFVSLCLPYLSLCFRAVPRAPGASRNIQQLSPSMIFLKIQKPPSSEIQRLPGFPDEGLSSPHFTEMETEAWRRQQTQVLPLSSWWPWTGQPSPLYRACPLGDNARLLEHSASNLSWSPLSAGRMGRAPAGRRGTASRSSPSPGRP